MIVLAGGLGTRISRLYPDIPKLMIPVAGRPFMDWVIRYFARQGLRRFVFALGHLAHVVEAYLARRPPEGVAVITVREAAPLGTGGALAHAAQAIPSCDPLVVTNGDSLVLADLSDVWPALARPDVDGVVLGARVEDASRYGTLKVDPRGRLLAFGEKQPGRGLVNAGVYFLRRRLVPLVPVKTPVSLEVTVLPMLLDRGANILVFPCDAPFLDIGTPEGLAQAEDFITRGFTPEGLD